MMAVSTERESYAPQDLRADIRAAELAVARVKRGVQGRDVLELLRLLDRIEAGKTRLSERGVDLRPEQSRIETVENTLLERARVAVKALSALAPPEALRAEVDAQAERWWWYLDRRVAESNARQVRRAGWSVGIGAVVLAVLVTVYMLFLRPDETTRLRYGYVSRAEGEVEQGAYESALDLYQKALEVAPDDPEVNLMIGIVYEALDRPEEAADYYARAETLYESRTAFLATKSQRYSLIGWYEQSELTALEAIDLDSEYAWAYCNLASGYEGQGRIPEAIGAVQACADLAREQGQDELYVIAAQRLALLLQMPFGTSVPGPQEQQRSE
jgi:tetratricopeptide (TPR) repeat protein